MQALIVCSNCESQYCLNNTQWNYGILVRCSVCKHVWRLDNQNVQFEKDECTSNKIEENEIDKTANQVARDLSLTIFKKELTKEELFRKLPMKLETKIVEKNNPLQNEPIIIRKKSYSSKMFSFIVYVAVIGNILFWTFYFTDLWTLFRQFIENYHLHVYN